MQSNPPVRKCVCSLRYRCDLSHVLPCYVRGPAAEVTELLLLDGVYGSPQLFHINVGVVFHSGNDNGPRGGAAVLGVLYGRPGV
jgi:hypothetical protein